jgi:hypothetical protein
MPSIQPLFLYDLLSKPVLAVARDKDQRIFLQVLSWVASTLSDVSKLWYCLR